MITFIYFDYLLLQSIESLQRVFQRVCKGSDYFDRWNKKHLKMLQKWSI